MTTTPQMQREEFASLLTKLIHDRYNSDLQIRAANLGIRIALQEGDSKAADLVDSVMQKPRHTKHIPSRQEELHVMATMRATRKAIALSQNRDSTLPLPRVSRETADAKQLRALIEDRIHAGELQVAKTMALVGLSRHPTDNDLYKMHDTIRQHIENRRQTAPIPFPTRH